MADKIDIFTAALRTEFVTSFEAIATPAPIERAMFRVPSTAREENYAWLSPVPAVDQYKGHRRYGKISSLKYKVANLEYDTSFEVLNRDVRDDQASGYLIKAKDLSKKCKLFSGRKSLQNLAAGGSTVCFDGSNFFANGTGSNVHIQGTGINDITFTCQNPAGTNCLIGLVVNSEIKPLFWQDRFGPDFDTDAGTPESRRGKISHYWADMEGASGFGYWYDACRILINGLPTVVEMQSILGLMESQFRTFQAPKVLMSDTPEYIHEQTEFNESTLVLVCSTPIGNVLRQALSLSLINQTENVFKGFGYQITSAFLNTPT